MAMVLNQAAQLSGSYDFTLPAAKLGNFVDRVPFRYLRFPAWFPGPGGATHPLAAFAGLRDYIRQNNLPWRVDLTYRQANSDLARALQAGWPTLIYGMGATGIPHVVVPIAKNPDGWLILDPGYPPDRNPTKWTDEQLGAWWKNFSIFYPRGTMISLKPV